MKGMTTIDSRPPADADAFPLHRFSTDDYLQMIEVGALGPSDKVELIDGIIVDMSPAGPRHNHVLFQLTHLFAPVFQRTVIAVQGTLVVGEGQVFDPDFMLLRPKEGGYKHALPLPADVLLLIEAADTLLKRDRQVKLPIYAAAGVGEYWIADIDDESLIVHRDPHKDGYARSETLRGDQTLAPLALADFTLSVRNIFD
jgi:Uma2 family endonuclease